MNETFKNIITKLHDLLTSSYFTFFSDEEYNLKKITMTKLIKLYIALEKTKANNCLLGLQLNHVKPK